MISKQIIDSKQWAVKCPYSITPVGISVHNTGNLNSTAQNERDNLNWTRDERSFHFVTDKNGTIQCCDLNRNTWANSDYNKGWNSKAYLNWEICEKDYEQSEKQAIKDIAQFLVTKGWNVDKIKNHSTFDKTSGCPRKTLPHWDKFIQDIKDEMERIKPAASGGVKYYKVQVGAYKNLSNAERMVQELKSKGYNAIIVKYY